MRRGCAARRSESLRFVERSERESVSALGTSPSFFAWCLSIWFCAKSTNDLNALLYPSMLRAFVLPP